MFILSGCLICCAFAQRITVTIQAGSARPSEGRGSAGRPISPDIFGIFFEDLNYAADGGLYAEMVQNRSFEYSSLDHPGWHAFTGWEMVKRGGAKGSYFIGDANPLHPNNPRYLETDCDAGGEGSAVGISNSGFDGMVLKKGEEYNFTVFARQQPGRSISLEIRLESKDGALRGRAEIPQLTSEWKKYSATILADKDDENGRLILLARGRGIVYLDMISLFPQKTFRNRPNGLRADLAQAIADLKPRFIRFPGGCLVHGDGLKNLYRWKDTIGPVEHRREQKNIWRYHQTLGLGYFEYFQFCEDIGAKPLPVVAAGVSCQNTDRYWGVGQQAIAMEEMPAYVQEVLDVVEWANGPAATEWGARRAEAGHPEPFNLQYLGVGNEDAQTPAFRERFKIIYNAVKAKYPDLTVIGTVGPNPEGPDYDNGWKFADELRLEMVDEHCYKPPHWFWANLDRFDAYDRSRSKVYLGEYAAHDVRRQTTLRSALAEAAYMTSLERNGDMVRMSSYAPLLGKLGHTQWNPDLIYFTNTTVNPTINYYVQQMFNLNAGDFYLPVAVDSLEKADNFALSPVRDSKSGDIIVKLVNGGPDSRSLRIELVGVENIATNAVKTILSGDPLTVNDAGNPQPLVPEISTIAVGPVFDYESPPHSLTVIRIKSQTP